MTEITITITKREDGRIDVAATGSGRAADLDEVSFGRALLKAIRAEIEKHPHNITVDIDSSGPAVEQSN